jgi:ABC-2 type transport system permease protein
MKAWTTTTVISAPYQFRQARISEFPDYAQFAQSYPNTFAWSEGIGFIADFSRPTKIDYVTYVGAHEFAHQWWAHQVIGAEHAGRPMLSETLAQYSALMVMEKMYGREPDPPVPEVRTGFLSARPRHGSA